MALTRFICLKQGHKYGIEYVNILHNRIRHYLPSLTEFVCYTDTPDMKFDEGVTVVNLPNDLGIYGWWYKCWILAQPHPGRNLYMDLDMLILGDCEFYRPLGRGLTGLWNRVHLNSSILAWHDGLPDIWRRFQQKKPAYLGAGGVVGDQEVINDTVEHHGLKLHYWDGAPTAWLDIKDPKTLARNYSNNTKTVVCKGPRNPHQHPNHPLVYTYWRKM